MSITGAVTNSVDAMLAQSHALGTISQNIANVNSTGYKTVETDFATILSQNYNDTSAVGVKAIDRNLIRGQGVITPTSQGSDLAISGKGFFIVNSMPDGSGGTSFTRNGAMGTVAARAVDAKANDTKAYVTTSSGQFLMGYAATPTATSTSTSGLTSFSYDPKNDTMAAKSTSAITVKGNVPVTTNSSSTFSTSLSAFDATGASSPITVTMTPSLDGSGNVIPLQWDATFTNGANTTTATLTFDTSGNLTSGSPVSVATSWGSVSMDLSSLKENSSSSLMSMTEMKNDGYPSGTFSSISFDSDGSVKENFSNGQSKTLGTIAFAQFVEPNNLQPVSDTMFTATTAAGAMEVGTTSLLSGQTTLTTNALEGSTVNIETQFSDMIQVQQAYQSAGKLWGAADQMMTTLRDLVRGS